MYKISVFFMSVWLVPSLTTAMASSVDCSALCGYQLKGESEIHLVNDPVMAVGYTGLISRTELWNELAQQCRIKVFKLVDQRGTALLFEENLARSQFEQASCPSITYKHALPTTSCKGD